MDYTPIFDRLCELKRRNIRSFHALPLANLGKNDVFDRDEYLIENISESSITGDLFDNFFFPHGSIKESQKLTSHLYNSDASFYITCGTSIANQIAITSLYNKGDRILIDKNCHQSIHFHINSIGAKVDYIVPDVKTDYREISAWSYDNLENSLLSMQQKGKQYDILVLTAHSYEGIIYDIPQVLERLMASGVKTRKFFIDEAWGSLNYFSEDTKCLTAMNIDSLRMKYPDIDVICTHSAHKSLFCLRQASIIHCKGTSSLPERIEAAKCRIHTTSPNYPILASLDLSQANMVKYGKELVSYARSLVKEFLDDVLSLSPLTLISPCDMKLNSYWHIHHDPTKVLIDFSKLGCGLDIKRFLSNENIYVNRTIENIILFNFHIGINKDDVSSLISAIKKINDQQGMKLTPYGNKSEKFIIPYPPGVPLVFPGDTIDQNIQNKLEQCRRDGCLIIES